MANFANPTVGSNYTAFPGEIRDSVNAALQQLSIGTHTNIPTGAIKFDTSLNRWRKYNGSAFVDLTTTYNLNANVSVNQLNLGDNEQIRVGNSNDLLIYHNASASYIQDNGTGKLILAVNGPSIDFNDTANSSAPLAKFITGGSCELYENGTKRLETTTNGIQVTSALGIGRAAALTLDVEGSAQIGAASTAGAELRIGRSGSGNRNAFIDFIGDDTYTDHGFRIIRKNGGANTETDLVQRGTGSFRFVNSEAAGFQFFTSATQKATITSAGNFAIGTTSASAKFHLKGASGTYPTSLIEHSNVDTDGEFLRIGRTDISGIRYHSMKARHGGGASGNYISFNIHNSSTTTSQSEVLRMRGDGNVGIGTTSPDVKLDVARLGAAWSGQDPIAGTAAHFHNGNNNSASPAYIGLGAGTASISGINFGDADDADVGKLYYRHTTNNIEIYTNAAERMRIDSSGNVGIGTTSINRKFHVTGTSGQTIFELQRTNANTGGALGTISFTASDDHSVASISAIGDGDNEGANIVFRTTSAAAANDPYDSATPTRFTITSTGNLKVPDNGRLIFGTGNGTDGDLQIYHTSNNNYIDCPASGTGHLIIKADDFLVQGSNAESMIKGIENAGVELFHNNNSKFYTTSLGAVVNGRLGVGTETSPSHAVDIKSADNTLLLLESTDRHALLEIHDTGGNIALGNDQGNLRLMAAGSDRIRINSSGVGIGTTSPDHTLEIRQATTSHRIVSINRGNSNVAAMYLGTDSADNAKISVNGDSNNIVFGKDNSGTFTQFMSINTNGDLFLNNDRFIKWGTSDFAYIQGNDNSFLAFGVDDEVFRCSETGLRIGQTSTNTPGQDNTTVGAGIGKDGRICSSTSGTITGINLNTNTESNSKHYISFRRSGNQIGSVTQNGASNVAYNTSSDRRLKENIVDLKDALTNLLKLKPRKFNFIADKTKQTIDGLIAQEVEETGVCLNAVWKDKEDKEMMQIDYSKFMTLAIAAIQELAGKVSDLEAKLG